jgi:hypothetical protein
LRGVVFLLGRFWFIQSVQIRRGRSTQRRRRRLRKPRRVVRSRLASGLNFGPSDFVGLAESERGSQGRPGVFRRYAWLRRSPL